MTNHNSPDPERVSLHEPIDGQFSQHKVQGAKVLRSNESLPSGLSAGERASPESDLVTHKRANTPKGPETASSVTIRPISLSVEASNQSLDVRILGTLQTIPGHGEKKGFFPKKTLVNLIDQDSIREQLEQCSMDLSPDVIETWSRRICGLGEEDLSFKKVFTLLVLMDKAADIPLFMEESVSDDKLPLQKLPRKEENIFDLAFRPSMMDFKVSPLQCFRGWKPAAIRNFEEWQWSTSAAFFPRAQYKDVPHFNFEDERPLPFTKDSRFNWGPAQERLEYDGGFSSVFKVQIHPEHHDLHEFHDNNPVTAFKDAEKQCLPGSDSSCHQDQTQKFAIKRLLSHDEEEFKREADTLKRFSDGSYLHLVSLLATYQQYKRYYLVFPCARGDLKDYWSRQNPQPEINIDTVQWVAKQCRGIAEGLGQIHRYVSKYSKERGVPTEELYGKHGDIKPQNILWFNDRHHRKGILKITDFGLAEFKTSLSTFCRPQTRMVVSPSYRAPECDLSNGVGRSSDIWALGCVYLEMVTWLLGGRILMEEFFDIRLAIDPHWENMRTDVFFECVPEADSPSAQLKSTVKEFIKQKLRAHERCTKYIGDFLDLIETHMLIPIEPPDAERHIHPGRIKIDPLSSKLRKLDRNCKNICYALHIERCSCCPQLPAQDSDDGTDENLNGDARFG